MLKLPIENGGRGIHLAKGQPSSLSITMHELLRCTTFPTTFVRYCTSVHKNRFKACAVFLSFYAKTLSIFFHSLLAWILLRSQQSVRSLSCRHLSRKSGKTEVSEMPSKETDLWKDGIDKQDELLRYDEKKC